MKKDPGGNEEDIRRAKILLAACVLGPPVVAVGAVAICDSTVLTMPVVGLIGLAIVVCVVLVNRS